MTDRPVIFSAPMVRALIEDRKTQTRRIFKPQPTIHATGDCTINGHRGPIDYLMRDVAPRFWATWRIGDRLWVREAWRTFVSLDDVQPASVLSPERGAGVCYEAGGGASISQPPRRDFFSDYSLDERHDRNAFGRLRPSIHMPREFSRLTLVVTEVRVQRLQEISEEDAMAEGVYFVEPNDEDREWNRRSCEEHGGDPDEPMQGVWMAPGARQGWGRTKVERNRDKWGPTASFAYRCVWNSIHGEGAWAENPWVAAISFSVERRNIDAGAAAELERA